MKKRPPLWKRLVLSIVTGAAVAVVMRSVQGRRSSQRQVPVVPAPSKEWPPLPDLAAPAAPATPAPAPAPADEPVPVVAPSPVSAVVVTPAVRVEAAVTTPEPAASSAPADEVDTVDEVDEVDTPADAAPAPVVRVPGDGPGGAVGTIVTEERPGSGDRLGHRIDDASDQEHLVTDPEPEAVLPDERIDRAREEQAVIAAGDDDVPPAPEPTFGTVPDPEAAAEAPVPVATPIEPEPEEELPIPHRPAPGRATAEGGSSGGGSSGGGPSREGAAGTGVADLAGDDRGAEPASARGGAPERRAAPKAKRGSTSAKAEAGAVQRDAMAERGAETPWIVPTGGACPGSHPVKAELSSGLFHVPGAPGYDGAAPDRCYINAGAAEADGLRPGDG